MRTGYLWGMAATLTMLLTGCAPDKAGRIVAPEAYGLTCVSATLCLEDVSRRAQADALYKAAARDVQAWLVPFKAPPRMLFCSSPSCSEQFGNQHADALTLGTYGILIRDTGWRDYVVRHEMIHHIQNEQFGVRQASYNLPKWYIEGMAYSMSRNPNRPIRNATAESYRKQFEAWIAAGNRWTRPPTP